VQVIAVAVGQERDRRGGQGVDCQPGRDRAVDPTDPATAHRIENQPDAGVADERAGVAAERDRDLARGHRRAAALARSRAAA
jgi:hypothetical protein